MFRIVLIFNKYLTSQIICTVTEYLLSCIKIPVNMSKLASKFNTFLFFKLPSAFLCGVRVKSIDNMQCVVSVKHRWINQNPFNSMYFAVQAMAAELSTGALLIDQIRNSGQSISMLVANNKGNFSKKATGRINFVCNDGEQIANAIKNTLETGEGQTFWMKAIGTNEQGVQVSEMDFEWSIRKK